MPEVIEEFIERTGKAGLWVDNATASAVMEVGVLIAGRLDRIAEALEGSEPYVWPPEVKR